MSYSFNVQGATKAAAKEKVGRELAAVVQAQPTHGVDFVQAARAAGMFIDMLPDDPARDISVSVHGSVGWSGHYPTGHAITSASIGISAQLVLRG